MTASASEGVTPADKFLTTSSNTIDANNRLSDNVFISDPSTTDNDVLIATLLAPTDAPAPVIQNVETFNVQSAVAGGKLSMAAITGANTVNVLGSNSVALSGLVQNGSVDFVLQTNKALTLEGKSASSTADVFNLGIQGAATSGASITLSDSTAGTAVAIAEVNLESLGTTTNILNLVSVSADDYSGITALNIAGTAGLNLTTNYAVKSTIDASELEGDLSLNLVGLTDASIDFADYITGSVQNLTLSGYALDSSGVVADTTGLDGLESVSLAANTATTATDLTLNVNAGVGVNLIASDTADDDARIVVTGASTGTADTLDLGIGGAAAVDFAIVTAAGVETLNIASTTTSATAVTNTIDDIGATAASAFTAINVTAAANADLGLTNTYVKAGTAAASNVVALTTAGDGDIAFGNIVTATGGAALSGINGITLSSAGAGDRSFTIAAAGDLKATASASQAAGTGVVLTGAGTGDIVISAAAATLDTLKVNATAFSGEAIIATDATTGAINATNWTGVDTLLYTGNRATNGVTNLAAGVKVVATAETTSLVEITNKSGVTEQTVEMAHDAGTSAITVLTANSVRTLDILTNDGARTANSTFTVATLNATSATEINITADEFAGVSVTNAYTTLTPAVGFRDVVVNMRGAGAIDLAGGLTATALDSLTVNASGEGARAIGVLTASDLISGSELRLTGDQDLLIDALKIVAADGETIVNDSSADLTITALTGTTIATTKTLTLDLTSVEGGETFTITDASALDFKVSAKLAISGNKDVVIGSNEATSLVMQRASSASDDSILDLTELTGAVTAFIQDLEGADTDVADIKLGTGETTITLYGGGVDGARVLDDGIFDFLFNADGVADTSITGFLSMTSGTENDDILNFSDFDFGTAGEIVTLSSIRAVVENTLDQQILEIVDVGSNLEITSLTGAFDGTITLVGIDSITKIEIDNFVFG
ncbi:hypothetical protein ICN30_08125 [Polynucleobacter sp. 31A-FELB]|uniref:beta strand repeat-containing protein n=1 Tax=Polynucleobacter sp. 31A-FELB TaxID=2689096 RepID=UPI001C0DC0C7|nr:hypothetical protein [Polynucleobacter sp. 31A-FELB]MBU3587798.1 hypothetical protein [Polynucleobacter sp. 31A-FELB]